MFENHPEFSGHEKVVFHYDSVSGLKAIIAIHNTSRGPALGGCRMYPYANEADALSDVLRLSRGMTYKAAIANLPLGGGKMVIIGDPKKDKTPELFRAAGKFIASLGGKYISGEDVGVTTDDCRIIGEVTQYVGGICDTPHGGDPSPMTALGVECAILAAIQSHFGGNFLYHVTCAVEGLGKVGFPLARRLAKAGATLFASDLDQKLLLRAWEEVGVGMLTTDELRGAGVDVYVPCALGGVMNDETVHTIKAQIVCGSANNVLARPDHGDTLFSRGITYVPDYVANCGGLIDIYYQRAGYDPERVEEHIHRIAHDVVLDILTRAKVESRPPHIIANEIAESRFIENKRSA